LAIPQGYSNQEFPEWHTNVQILSILLSQRKTLPHLDKKTRYTIKKKRKEKKKVIFPTTPVLKTKVTKRNKKNPTNFPFYFNK